MPTLPEIALAASPDPMLVFDESRRCAYANPAAARALGRAVEQVVGRTMAEVGIPAGVARRIGRQLDAVVRSGGSVTGEVRLPTPAGERDFEHVLTPVYLPGVTSDERTSSAPLPPRVAYVVASVRDVTGRKAVERELKHARDAAEGAGMAKDQFLAALSHELRTPLTPVLATVTSLEADGDLPPALRPVVEMIRRNVELQARLIDDLLDLTRVAKGKINLSLARVDLHAAVRDTLEICRADAGAERHRIDLALADDARFVLADAARLRQIVWNLLKNAVKFTPTGSGIGGGAITVRCAAGDDVTVVLEVTDTGIGMTPDQLGRAFLPFEQGDPTIGRRFGGLGLGLAITRALVELHGGTITATSDGPGRGTSFTVRLPACQDEDGGARAEEGGETRDGGARQLTSSATTDLPSPTSAAPLRVLVVDDHADTARAIRRLLTAGAPVRCEVRTAGSVGEALTACRDGAIDLLISDIGLPDGSGLDLMRELRARHGADQVKGIALSGYGMEDDVRRSRTAGYDAHLTKPVTAAALHGAVRAVVGSPS